LGPKVQGASVAAGERDLVLANMRVCVLGGVVGEFGGSCGFTTDCVVESELVERAGILETNENVDPGVGG
jgi:hypothetical protein